MGCRKTAGSTWSSPPAAKRIVQHVRGCVEGFYRLYIRRQQACQAACSRAEFDYVDSLQRTIALDGRQDVALIVLALDQAFVLVGVCFVNFFFSWHDKTLPEIHGDEQDVMMTIGKSPFMAKVSELTLKFSYTV